MCFVKMDFKLAISEAITSAKFFYLLAVLLALISDVFVEGSRPGCGVPLGMEDGRIKNSQLYAYSYDTGYYAKNGRLNGKGAWCSDSETPWTEYFQIRLDRVRHVSSIGTQGIKLRGLFTGTYWVKSYAIEYSYDGKKWNWYKDSLSSSSGIKVFSGNTDANTERRTKFRDTFVTKYLRIYPIDFKADMCLRVEVYGCPNGKDCTKVLTGPSGVISSPDYPLNYPVGIDCTWVIHLSDTSKSIAAFFKYMDVNNGAAVLFFCPGDYVLARNGLLDISDPLGEFCNGEDTPLIKSTGRSMYLHFHSNFGSIARRGFQMAYYSFTRGVDNVYRAVACTGKSLSLDCSSRFSKTIKILHASYGTSPFSTFCGSQIHNSSCQASGVEQKLTTLCKHLKVCTVDVSGPKFSSVNCQAGSVPHLVVYYQCTGTIIRTLPPTTTTTTAPPPPNTTTPPPTTHTTTLPTDVTTTPLSPQTKPAVPPSLVTGRASPSTPTVSATRTEDAGGKVARASGKDNPGMLIGIIVAVILVIIVLVVVLVCVMYRRRRKPKDKLPRTVTYTAAGNLDTGDIVPPLSRDGRGSSRNNPYETVNVLYVSADDARYKDGEAEHIYDSPDLHEPLPQMTDNPLYHGGLELESAGYENIDSQNLVPSSLDPAIYDSPLPLIKQKSGTTKSISNPNYGKTIEIPDK